MTFVPSELTLSSFFPPAPSLCMDAGRTISRGIVLNELAVVQSRFDRSILKAEEVLRKRNLHKLSYCLSLRATVTFFLPLLSFCSLFLATMKHVGLIFNQGRHCPALEVWRLTTGLIKEVPLTGFFTPIPFLPVRRLHSLKLRFKSCHHAKDSIL